MSEKGPQLSFEEFDESGGKPKENIGGKFQEINTPPKTRPLPPERTRKPQRTVRDPSDGSTYEAPR
jgi:hypothetical protein